MVLYPFVDDLSCSSSLLFPVLMIVHEGYRLFFLIVECVCVLAYVCVFIPNRLACRPSALLPLVLSLTVVQFHCSSENELKQTHKHL